LTFLFKHLKGDKVIWMVAIILSIFSLLSVYSSTTSLAFKYEGGGMFHFLIKHGIMIFSGFLIMYYVHLTQYKYYSRISQLAIWVAAILLVVTLLLGENLNDASRWLKIPIINQNFQTSDFAKVTLIVFLARILNQKQDILNSFSKAVIPLLIPTGIICVLILPANFSTAAILFVTCMVLMFLGGVAIKHLLAIVGSGVAVLLLLFLISSAVPELLPRIDTWKSRIVNFNSGDSDSNYQAEHAMMAIQSGGLLPNGPGNGNSRNYLPHPYSDMIYAFIIEEYGAIIGGIGILLLYLILLFRAIRLANKCEKRFGSLLVLGLSFMMVFQAFINMGVAVNLFPVTGQPLPMVSMGGTSVWFTSLAFGIILSVSREVYEEEAEVANKNEKYAVA
jgi:cell division protein FtsW